MTTVNTFFAKLMAIAMFPALAMGLFAAPALADEHQGNSTDINVVNLNGALVINAVSVSSDTGDNTSRGGEGGDGGNSGDSEGSAGNGGDGDDGGDGGDAEAEIEDAGEGKAYAESGDGAAGGDGAKGGNTGSTGNGGDGGYGGNGGDILTGDANASLGILNEVNTNDTKITIEEDCCGQYNEFFMSADRYYEQNRDERFDLYYEDTDTEWRDGGCGRRCQPGGGSEDKTVVDVEGERSGNEIHDEHFEMYVKQFVPVSTHVNVVNANIGVVANFASVDADTGDNTSRGADGGDGGNSGDSNGSAGNGGDGDDGGDGGDAEAEIEGDKKGGDKPLRDRCGRHPRCGGNDDNVATAISGDGAEGGDGAAGGNTGATGDAGDGKSGGNGGVIVTGYADARADIIDVANHNVTRIVK